MASTAFRTWSAARWSTTFTVTSSTISSSADRPTTTFTGGRLYLVDFPPGPSVPTEISGTEHRIARETVLEHAGAAGLALAEEPDLLPFQYVLVLQSEVPNPTRTPQTSPSENEKP